MKKERNYRSFQALRKSMNSSELLRNELLDPVDHMRANRSCKRQVDNLLLLSVEWVQSYQK